MPSLFLYIGELLLKKDGVIWFDTERNKFRVAIGERQKYHIGRYDTLDEAEKALHRAIRAYRCGYNSAVGVVC